LTDPIEECRASEVNIYQEPIAQERVIKKDEIYFLKGNTEEIILAKDEFVHALSNPFPPRFGSRTTTGIGGFNSSLDGSSGGMDGSCRSSQHLSMNTMANSLSPEYSEFQNKYYPELSRKRFDTNQCPVRKFKELARD
jgi:hypothetical protein